ncbi:MAG: PTS sugar transporter subunit IIA [Eubacteriales bacterium]
MEVIHHELVNSSLSVVDTQDAITKIGQMLLSQDFVKDTFINAVLEREKEFPTGLNLKNTSVAMPHTDSIHVNKPAICVVRLDEPVSFIHMGSTDVHVEAKMIFMMAISDPETQLETLRKMMGVFHNVKAIDEFLEAKNNEVLYQIAKKYLG